MPTAFSFQISDKLQSLLVQTLAGSPKCRGGSQPPPGSHSAHYLSELPWWSRSHQTRAVVCQEAGFWRTGLYWKEEGRGGWHMGGQPQNLALCSGVPHPLGIQLQGHGHSASLVALMQRWHQTVVTASLHSSILLKLG